MIKLLRPTVSIRNRNLRRAVMVLIAPLAIVEGALNGVIEYAYGYRYWWSFEYPTENDSNV